MKKKNDMKKIFLLVPILAIVFACGSEVIEKKEVKSSIVNLKQNKAEIDSIIDLCFESFYTESTKKTEYLPIINAIPAKSGEIPFIMASVSDSGNIELTLYSKSEKEIKYFTFDIVLGKKSIKSPKYSFDKYKSELNYLGDVYYTEIVTLNDSDCKNIIDGIREYKGNECKVICHGTYGDKEFIVKPETELLALKQSIDLSDRLKSYHNLNK